MLGLGADRGMQRFPGWMWYSHIPGVVMLCSAQAASGLLVTKAQR